MKDIFSAYAGRYAQFRPVYPPELYDFLLSLLTDTALAWDVGTGNGQVASVLAKHFHHVIATDISQKQLDRAPQFNNITYQCEPAENTSIPNQTVDLITGAQAPHWFKLDDFYAEAKRVAKPNAILAFWCYSLLNITPELDSVIEEVYFNTLGDQYWDPERKLIDQGYQSILFPFEEICVPDMAIIVNWDLSQLMGYLNTWSAVQHYTNRNGINPLYQHLEKLEKLWGKTTVRTVKFPLHFRVGRLK